MPKFHRLKVRKVQKETIEAVSVAFEVPENLEKEFAFIHGQNLTLKAEIDGEDVRRTYSICTSPSEGELKVVIKKQPYGKFSTFANSKLKAGDSLEVMTPTGHFYTKLNPTQARIYVAFAAGSGITPVISILKTVLLEEPESRFILLYGNKGFDSIIFRDEIEALKNRYVDRLSVHHILSRENQEAKLFNGRICTEKCLQFGKSLIDYSSVDEFFICGPEQMIHEVRECLRKIGVEEKQIHFELFTSPAGKLGRESDPKPRKSIDSDKESLVSIKLDGTTFDFTLPYTGSSILNAALAKGADLPYACKGGVCATCRAKLVEGEVEMDVNYALVPEEIEQGFILTCQSHPRTEKVVVDFDVR